MAKAKTFYVCESCGHESIGWLGRCPSCGDYNSFHAQKEVSAPKAGGKGGSWLETGSDLDEKAQILDLSSLQVQQDPKTSTGISELDRVLGGGLVAGSLMLLGGDPGIGKSTLALAILGNLPSDKVLYVSGEESAAQIGLRSRRLGLGDKQIPLLTSTRLSAIERVIRERQPQLVIIDSIQTVYSEDLPSAPGSLAQVREAGMGFLRMAKSLGTSIILTGHVTKEGAIAGPRVLEHMVDTVLYFEGEKEGVLRILRSVKNRFAATNEIGIFEMTGKGLIPVQEATGLFLDGKPKNVPGSVVSALVEGSRPLLLEIQALTVESNYGSPIRMAQGLDRSRLIMLMAVAGKKTGIDFSALDAYVNVTGGLKVKGTSVDLAVLAALISSVKEQAIAVPALILGEVGLTGEIRGIARMSEALEEAYRAGWTRFILPSSAKDKLSRFEAREGVQVFYVSEVNEAFDLIFSKEGRP